MEHPANVIAVDSPANFKNKVTIHNTKSQEALSKKGQVHKKMNSPISKSKVEKQAPLPPKPVKSRVQIKLQDRSSRSGSFSPGVTLEVAIKELVPSFFGKSFILICDISISFIYLFHLTLYKFFENSQNCKTKTSK